MHSFDWVKGMTTEEFKQRVNTISRGYQMVRDIEECAELASQNPLLLPVLRDVLMQVVVSRDWKNPVWSRSLHILVNAGSSGSLFHVLDFIKKLPDSVPFALVELLGNLLPAYRRIVVGPAKELCEFPEGSAQRAIGIQTLCNLHLEGLLPPENLDYLAGLLGGFEVDPFFTDYLVDLVRSSPSFRARRKGQSPEADDDFLVELQQDEANGIP